MTSTILSHPFSILPRGARAGAWLLALTPAFYLPAVVLNAGAINILLAQQGIGQIAFVDLTPALMDAIRAAWIPFHASLYVATAVIPVAVLLFAQDMKSATTRVWRVGALITGSIAIPVVVVYSVLDVLAMPFTTPTLGEDPFYAVATALGFVVFGLTLVALACIAAAFIAAQWRPVLGWVIALAAVLFLVLTVIAPMSTPPFTTALLACPLGIGALRVPRRLRERSEAVVSGAS